MLDVSVRLSVHLSVTEVHWRIISNLGFKFRSKFTMHCSRSPQCARMYYELLCMWAHSACGRIVVAVNAGNTAAARASKVEAIIQSPTKMAAADVATFEGRGHLALC